MKENSNDHCINIMALDHFSNQPAIKSCQFSFVRSENFLNTLAGPYSLFGPKTEFIKAHHVFADFLSGIP